MNHVHTAPFLPVEDSIPKVDDKIAVGEDMDFQRAWWKFESLIWTLFLCILIADILGCFGRGPLAKATRTDSAQTVTIGYERIARTGTPSVMTLRFGPGSISNGHIQLFVSQSLIKTLGAQRISPQPATSTLGNDGITYAFDASSLPATVEIHLQPVFPGLHHFRIQVAGGQPIEASTFVVP